MGVVVLYQCVRFVTGLEPWPESDKVRNGLGVVLAKLLDVMQLEGLLLLVVDVVQREKLADRVQLYVQGCGLE
jgi:hypothetical protein